MLVCYHKYFSIIYRLEHKIKIFHKQTSDVKIVWDNENIRKLLCVGRSLYVIYSIQIYRIFLVRILTKVWFTISLHISMRGGLVAQAVRRSPPTAGVPSSRLGHSMWVSWWTKRCLGRFFSGFLPFSLPQI